MKTPEDLFRDGLGGYSEKPPQNLWNKIDKKLTWQRFLKPSFKTFNVYYAAALVVSIFVGSYHIVNNSNEVSTQKTQSFLDFEVSQTESSGKIISERKVDIKSGTKKSSNHSELSAETNNKDVAQNNNENFSKGTDINNKSVDDLPSSKKLEDVEVKSEVEQNQFTCNFSVDVNAGCAPLKVNLKNLSKNAEYSQWNFGNGEISYDNEPTVTYKSPGTYIITLKTVSGVNAKIITDTISVLQKPKPDIKVAISELNIIGEAKNIDNQQVNWNFGDGSVAVGNKRVHIYDNPGRYNIKVITGNNICADTSIKTVEVSAPKFSIVFPNAIVASNAGGVSKSYNTSRGDKSVFVPKGDVSKISKYILKIYNRNGKEVFSTINPNEGWGGYYNGALLPKGVYVYKVQYTFSDGSSYSKNGNITLFHEE